MILEEDQYARTKILNAIVNDPEIVILLKEKYVNDEIWKFCIEREPSLFKNMKHPSEALCMYACEIDGGNLKYIRNKFKYVNITDIMVMTALKSNPKAILYVPKKMLNDSLKEYAFDQDPSLMAYFDDIRYEYIEQKIEENPFVLQYIKYPSETLVCNAIKKSPNICSYINNMTDRMLMTLREYHPDYYALYHNHGTS